MFSPMQINRRSLRRKCACSPIAALTALGVAAVLLPLGVAANAHPLLPGATILSTALMPVGQGATEADADAAITAGDYPKAISILSPLIAATPRKFNLYLKRGIAYFKTSQFDKSVADFTTFISIRPALVEGYLNRAYAYSAQGDSADGLADIAKVASLDPTRVDEKLHGDLLRQKMAYPDAIAAYTKYAATGGDAAAIGQLLIGDCYAAQKDNANAVTAYTKGITADPKNSYGYAQRAKIYVEDKKPEAAIKDLTAYIALAPTDAFGYYYRGVAYLSLKTAEGYSAAVADFTKDLTLEKDPASQLEVTRKLAAAQSASGHLPEAIASYTKVLAADPKSSNALFQRGMAYMNTKDFPNAIKDFNQYATSFPTGADAGDAAYNLGSTYLLTSPPGYEQAIPAFTAAIKANPKDASSYFGRMVAEFNTKQYQKAVADSDAVIANGDASPAQLADTYKISAHAYDQLAASDKTLGMKAIAAMKKYVTVKPEDTASAAYYNDLIGKYSDPTTQIAEYTKSLTPEPTDTKAAALLHYNRAVAYAQIKDYAHEIADLTRVVALTPTDDGALVLLAQAYVSKGEPDLAIAAYGKAIALKPDETELLPYQGDLYIGKMDYVKADADYTTFLAKAGDKAPTAAILTAAQLKQALNKPDDAIALYNKYLTVEKDPEKTAEAQRRLGAAYNDKGDFPDAIKVYSDILAKNPSDKLALSNRAEAYTRTNAFDKALADINAALALEPSNAIFLTQRATINNKIGADWKTKGDPDKAKAAYDAAIADCTKASASDPNYLLSYYRKAFAAYGAADPDVSADPKTYYPVALEACQKFLATAKPTDPGVDDIKKLAVAVKGG